MDQRREDERRPSGWAAIDRGPGSCLGPSWLGRTLLLYRVDVTEAPAVRELIPAASPGAWVEIVVED